MLEVRTKQLPTEIVEVGGTDPVAGDRVEIIAADDADWKKFIGRRGIVEYVKNVAGHIVYSVTIDAKSEPFWRHEIKLTV